MAVRNTYKPGDWLITCDRTGFTIYASEARRQWDGLIVRDQSWEARHPQDFVRGIKDHQAPPYARPDVDTLTVGPFATTLFEDFSANETNLSVASISGISSGDSLRIVLDGGLDTKTVSTEGGGTATGGFHFTITTGLTGKASAGNSVLDLSSVTTATDSF